MDFPERWLNPLGDTILWDSTLPLQPLLREVASQSVQFLAKARASHYLGEGMETGVDYTLTLAWLKQLRKQGDAQKAGLLECILVGGVWTPWRAACCFDTLADCPRCGAPLCNDLHVFWGCPANSQLGPDVVDTQPLIEDAFVAS